MSTATDYKIEVSNKGLGYNRPQKMGRVLWSPMWLMAIMAFPVAFIVALVKSNKIADGAAVTTILAYEHVHTGIMFIGFAAVFAAISFAIARILGQFRKGGGDVQEAVGGGVHTLKMPVTARVFILGMVMAMMGILVASVLHFVAAANVASGAWSVLDGQRWAVVLEAVRRVGVATYLLAITFGLATIVTVVRFQATRIRELSRS